MKKLFFILSIILFSFSSSYSQFSSASLTAAGLTCAMCTKAIFNSLEKIPAVSSVDADIKNSAFLIKFREGASVDPDVLKKAVEEAGFSVARLKLTGNFESVTVQNDTHTLIDGKTYHFLKVPSKNLSGSQTLTLVDKNFVTAKEFKKYNTPGSHPCIESGRTEACCEKMGVAHSGRIYHVTL